MSDKSDSPRTGRPQSPISSAATAPLRELAATLRELRTASGLTLRNVGRAVHYDVTTLSRAETGKSVPSWGVVKSFLNAVDADSERIDDVYHLWVAAKSSVSTQDSPKEIEGRDRVNNDLSGTKFDSVMRSVAERMQSDFYRSSNFSHRGEKGVARETLFGEFLSNYVSRDAEVVRGAEIVDSEGHVSPQVDVVLTDATSVRLLDMDDYRVLFSETLQYAFEVKSQLDASSLSKACDNLRAVKNLKKSAFTKSGIPVTYRLHGRSYSYKPTGGGVFAYGGSDLMTLAAHFYDWCLGKSANEVPDTLWVLGQGFMQWINPENGRPDPAPSPGAKLGVFRVAPEVDVLLPLILHLGIYLEDAMVQTVDLKMYTSVNLSSDFKVTNESPLQT